MNIDIAYKHPSLWNIPITVFESYEQYVRDLLEQSGERLEQLDAIQMGELGVPSGEELYDDDYDFTEHIASNVPEDFRGEEL